MIAALALRGGFEISSAIRADAAWWFDCVALVIGGYLSSVIYRRFCVVERHLERSVMVCSYLVIAFIIFWGVVYRFIFNSQQPWSTTTPPLLFMIMAWIGAACKIRLRTHLSFSEFRTKMPAAGQMACLLLDFCSSGWALP